MMNRIRTPLSLGLIGTFLFFVPPRGETENFIYEVAPGDTLYSIARQYGVGVAALSEINKITDPSRLFVGQSLIIPRAYTVKPGDTLFGIARNHNLSLSELLALNNRVESQVLRVGEVLIVGDEVASTDSPPPSRTPVTTPPTPTDPLPTTQTTTTVTLNTQTTVAITPPRTAGTLLTSQLSTDGSGTTWPRVEWGPE
jgi:LysM repeat protein